jgi:hypothetical protein
LLRTACAARRVDRHDNHHDKAASGICIREDDRHAGSIWGPRLCVQANTVGRSLFGSSHVRLMRMATLQIDEDRALFVGVLCWLFPREEQSGQRHSVVEAQMERFSSLEVEHFA